MSDQELWRLHGVKADVVARVRAIPPAGTHWDLTPTFDLRIEQGGEVVATHLCRTHAELEARSATIKDTLLSQGWTERADGASA